MLALVNEQVEQARQQRHAADEEALAGRGAPSQTSGPTSGNAPRQPEAARRRSASIGVSGWTNEQRAAAGLPPVSTRTLRRQQGWRE